MYAAALLTLMALELADGSGRVLWSRGLVLFVGLFFILLLPSTYLYALIRVHMGMPSGWKRLVLVAFAFAVLFPVYLAYEVVATDEVSVRFIVVTAAFAVTYAIILTAAAIITWVWDGFRQDRHNAEGDQQLAKSYLWVGARRIGRSPREHMWILMGVILVSAVILATVGDDLGDDVLSGLVILYALAGNVASLVIGVRRLHDMDRTGWWLILVVIPIINIVLLLTLLFAKGVEGTNKFGEAEPGT